MKPLLRAALLVVPALLLLLALGTWQVRRLAWKTDLLARIDAAEAAPPRPLVDPPEPFTKVAAAGRFEHDREALLGVEVRGTTLGAHLIVPLERQGAPPVLVDRGWVPLERGLPVSRPAGEQRVVGWVRPGDTPGWFAARDDAAARRFYSFDPAAIGAALGLPAVAPYGLVALGEGGLPAPARHLPHPPNNHLGYVITWYGLAAALVGVFAAWARRRLKESA